jgi:hypothetical protein
VDEPQTSPQNAILRARREILEVLLHEPAIYASVVGRLTRDDFGPEGPFREIADIVLGFLETGVEPELVRLYGRIEEPETAALLTEIASTGGVKGVGPRRLEDSICVIEEYRHRQDMEAHKGRLTDEATDALRQIDGRLKQQKGNLRCGGLQ